jgi:glycosyltransferase involved in cell wall biosynthesis
MRICLFTDSFLPYISGVSTAVFNQANELAARGHEVSVFHPRAKRRDRLESVPGLDPSIQAYGLPLSVGVSNVPMLRFSVPLFLYTYMRLKRADPDVIHVHSEFGCGLEGMLLGRWKRVPVIGTFHTFFAEPEYLKQFRIPNFEITRKAMWKYSVTFYNRCCHIVSPSKSVREHLVTRGLTRPATLMSNGIDRINFRPREEMDAYRRSLGIADFAFIYVGRVSMEKSLDIVLKAFRETLKVNPRAKLVIVGNGPSDGPLDQWIPELGLADSVIRTGRIERDQLMKDNVPLLGDVFVTASKTENQPVSLLEAMAFGLPMIGPRAKGIPELVEDGVDGVIFEPDDVEELAEAMTRLMENETLCRELSAAAIRNANEHRIDKIGKQLEEIYQAAIDSKKS